MLLVRIQWRDGSCRERENDEKLENSETGMGSEPRWVGKLQTYAKKGQGKVSLYIRWHNVERTPL